MSVEKYNKRCEYIFNQLNKGHISQDNYDSTKQPFFLKIKIKNLL